ncbi:unnamed protein product [Urochloa humidicola]
MERNITSVPPFNTSFSIQIGWLEQLKPSLMGEYLNKSLFIMGEFGGNDYVFLLAANKTVEQTKTYVPAVVNAVAGGVERLIKLGAKRLVVPGNLPMGCTSIILTLYASPNKEQIHEALHSNQLLIQTSNRGCGGKSTGLFLERFHPSCRLIQAMEN